MTATTVDARNLLCPMPVIRASQRIAELPAGATLVVVCTDPGARHDIPAWCRMHGHSVLAITKDDDIRVTIQVGTGAHPQS